jgi:hypothetical protein
MFWLGNADQAREISEHSMLLFSICFPSKQKRKIRKEFAASASSKAYLIGHSGDKWET